MKQKKGSLFISGMILLIIICAVDIERHQAEVATFLSTYNIMVIEFNVLSASFLIVLKIIKMVVLKCYYDEILMSCLSQRIIYISSVRKTVT